MRKFIILLFILIPFSHFVHAQKISDEQVIQYVMEAQEKGLTQQQIATDLLRRGVTMDQVNRLKERYEKSGQTGFVGKTVNEKEKRTRSGSQLKDNNFQIRGEEKDKLKSRKSEFFSDSDMEMGKDREKELIDGMSFLYTDSTEMLRALLKRKDEKEIFGHSIFRNRNLTFEPSLNIATPLNYQLGPGDEVIIDIWGASQTTIRETISPEGTIQVENLGPVYLNGLTVKAADAHLKEEFSKIYSGIAGENPNSQIKLTLGEIRSIQVNIMGEVKTPGTYTLSSFATVFHALYQADGVSDIGSLRTIKVYRENKLKATLDIYEYIMEGRMSDDVRLMDNDVIVVEPYNCLVNLVGKVKRPMYYELKPVESVASLLKYAGGFTGDAYTKNVRIIRKSGREHQIYNIEEFDFSMFSLADGDSVTVDSVLARFANRVEVKGAVYRPGMYQMDGAITTIKELINAAEGVRGDAFLNRGVLHRENEDLTLQAMSVDIKGLLNGTIPDIALQKNDILFIPSIHDIQENRTLRIYGEIAFPGLYEYAENSTLEDVILQAGGLKEAASTVRVDVSRRIKNPKALTTNNEIAQTFSFSLKDGFVVDGEVGFTLEPFDEIYVRKSPGYQQQQNVMVEGEVLFGGTYALNRKNQRLSELIVDAGGLTPEAYARGARLERKMTEEEKLRMKAVIRMAEIEKASMAELDSNNPNSALRDSLMYKTLDLGDTYYVGIELDKALAQPGGDADIVLREGDKVIVPQFTSTVKINGAVMHPNTVTYKQGQKKSYYIDMAGGYNFRAKKSRAYVIYMNGTVARLKSGSRDAIQPGCEIVVPTKQLKRGLSIGEIMNISTSTVSMATLITSMASTLSKK